MDETPLEVIRDIADAWGRRSIVECLALILFKLPIALFQGLLYLGCLFGCLGLSLSLIASSLQGIHPAIPVVVVGLLMLAGILEWSLKSAARARERKDSEAAQRDGHRGAEDREGNDQFDQLSARAEGDEQYRGEPMDFTELPDAETESKNRRIRETFDQLLARAEADPSLCWTEELERTFTAEEFERWRWLRSIRPKRDR